MTEPTNFHDLANSVLATAKGFITRDGWLTAAMHVITADQTIDVMEIPEMPDSVEERADLFLELGGQFGMDALAVVIVTDAWTDSPPPDGWDGMRPRDMPDRREALVLQGYDFTTATTALRTWAYDRVENDRLVFDPEPINLPSDGTSSLLDAFRQGRAAAYHQAAANPLVEEQWARFESGLARVLAGLPVNEERFLIIRDKLPPARYTGTPFVQFAIQPEEGLLSETISEQYLGAPLDADQAATLAYLGWARPTLSLKEESGEATGEHPTEGSPNYFREFRFPVPAEALAEMAVRTLREVWAVPDPERLEYVAYLDEGTRFAFPELGIARRHD